MLPHPWRLDVSTPEPVIVPAPKPEPITLTELERRHIRYALHYADGNKSRAARLLGIDRRTLYRKLAEYAAEG
jgi:DNA-binding NtrC family response regulator